ncbi:ankyrin repeat domain-containing protein [Desulfococcaceae bacterium HSG9]|nr:ankyrin repeat domain-containing protein [Desulfococcaceae bacterium HSG9]
MEFKEKSLGYILSSMLLLLSLFGCVTLHEAAHNGELDRVRKLIENGEDINKRDSLDFTPLMEAVGNSDGIDTVKYLISQGADLNLINCVGKNALMYAAYFGNNEIVEYLLTKRVDINAKDKDGRNALMLTNCYQKDIVKTLLINGIDVLAEDDSGKNALSYHQDDYDRYFSSSKDCRKAITFIEEKIKGTDEYKHAAKYEKDIEFKIKNSGSALQQVIILSNILEKYESRIKSNQFLEKYFDVFDDLRVAKQDIVVTIETSDCTTIPILGTSCTNKLYAGKVLKNDIVYLDRGGRRIRTINKEKNLSKINTYSGDSELDNWNNLLGEEAFGETSLFKEENNLHDSDLYHKNFNVRMPDKYYPTSFSKKWSSSYGGILGFIEDHPIISLVAGAAIVKALDSDSSSSSSSSSYSSGSGSLLFNVSEGSILPTTVKKFTVKLKGTDNYISQEDSSGNGFFQGGYSSFYNLEPGNYDISFYGINQYGKNVFSMSTSYYYPGGDKYCNVNTSTKSMTCR